MPNKEGCRICGKDRRQRCLCPPGTPGSLKEHAVNTRLQTKTRSCEDDAPLEQLLANPRAKKEKHEHPNKTTQRAKEKHRENFEEKARRKTREPQQHKGKGTAAERNTRREHKRKRARSTSSSAAEDKRQGPAEDQPSGGWKQGSGWWKPWWENKWRHKPWWENKGWREPRWENKGWHKSWGREWWWEGESGGYSSAPPGAPPAQPVQHDKNDYYATLGLATTATGEEIRDAYSKLSQKVHPEKGGTAALFGKVLLAYRELSDPCKRQAYDLACGHKPRPSEELVAPENNVCKTLALPSTWTTQLSKSTGRIYYYRPDDGHFQWAHPSDQLDFTLNCQHCRFIGIPDGQAADAGLACSTLLKLHWRLTRGRSCGGECSCKRTSTEMSGGAGAARRPMLGWLSPLS